MKTKTIEITLPKDLYISDIEPYKSTGIPTNSITHKEVPGCGITTFEYRYAKHHSIIILPNVPVIETKVKEHNEEFPDAEILGVFKGIDVYDIKVYLLKDIKYKKILTTPEGFSKVLRAFEDDLDYFKENYFLLYDECERIITDVSYRGKMTAPMDLFFEFTNKAMVSATTLKFSDERFKDFDHYTIKPDYDYSKPLTVITTNSVLESTKQHIAQLGSEHVCIFINSTNGIYALAEWLNIKAKSKTFCAQESVVKLMEKGYMNASKNFDKHGMAQYNFFTSRYFSAVDVKLDYQPDVIMITDVIFADHSIIDPHTEAIQIAGRFRNGVNSLTHITNFDPMMEVKTKSEALTYLTGCLDTYEHVLELFNKSQSVAMLDTLAFFVKESPIANFFSKGKRNPFMIDNDLNAERVKGYYVDQSRLEIAYNEVAQHFNTTFFNEEYTVGDGDFRILNRLESKVERNKHIATLLARYTAKPGSFTILLSEDSRSFKDKLTYKYPVIAEAVKLVGLEYLNKIGFETSDIKRVITDARRVNKLIEQSPFVYSQFNEHSIVLESEVVSKLTKINTDTGGTLKTYATHILKFFNGARSTKLGVNVYNLQDKKFILPIHKM